MESGKVDMVRSLSADGKKTIIASQVISF